MGIAEAIGRMLAPILVPIIKEALYEFFKDTAELGKPDPDLQQLWDAGLRSKGDIRPAGDGGRDDGVGKEGPVGGARCEGEPGSVKCGSSAWDNG